MNEALIAGRYTKALFSLADTRGALDKVKNDMEYLYQVFRESKPFQVLLDNPVLRPSQKIRIFNEVFPELHPLSRSTVEIIFKNRREDILPFVALDFIEKYFRARNISRVIIKTAVSISSQNLERIKRILTEQLRNEIIVTTEVDSALIGGFILRIADNEIDASVRRKLKKLQQQLVQSQIK